MLPRIEGSYYPHHRREIPLRQVPLGTEPSLFSPVGAPLRRLVVMVDAPLLSEPQLDRTLQEALRVLLSHPFVQYYLYGHGGLPPVPAGDELGGASRRWVVLDERTVRYWDGQWRVEGLRDDVGQGVGAGKESDRQAIQVAATVGVDFYITERDHLLSAKGWLREYPHLPALEPPCYSVREALALVGLYLRAQGEYVLDDAADSETFGHTAKKRFFWRAARMLLPAYWRWLNAIECAPYEERQDWKVVYSLAQRIEFALDQRDAVHWALNQPDDAYAANEIFGKLDYCLLLLMGTFDAAALVAHQLLSRRIGAHAAGPMESAGWQRRTWLKTFAQVYPEPAALMAKGSPGYELLTIVRLVRNTIHSEATAITARVFTDNYGYYPLLRLSAPRQDQLLRAIDTVGDRPSWGVENSHDGAAIDPGVFLERLFPSLIRLLGELMDRIPVTEIIDSEAAPTNHRHASPSNASWAGVHHQLGIEL